MVQKNEIPPILASNVRSNLWTYLHKPKYKEALADALTKHPELKNQLASTLFSEETRVNAWEVFYKNFKDLSPGEISFVQMYLCLFKNKSPEGVGYWLDSCDSEMLKKEFDLIKRENITNYILRFVMKDPRLQWSDATYALMSQIDCYISKTNLDANENWHLDKEELQKIAQDVATMMTETRITQKRNEFANYLERYDFDIAHSLTYSVDFWKEGQIVYETLDRHLPLTTDHDFSKKLSKTIWSLQEWMRWNPDIYVDPDGSEKKLVNQTQEKLKALIRNFFEQHKDQLKENGIEYLEGISPQNAAKLSAIISMQYLSYSHAQAISPNEETQYIKWLSTEERKEYLLEKERALDLALYIQIILAKWGDTLTTEDVFHTLPFVINWSSWVSNTHLTQQDRDRMMKEYPEIVDMIYLNTSELLRRKEEVDLLSVDQLLKQGKWVCRNYAVANAKIFDAIKALQPRDDNQLKNSALPVIISKSGRKTFWASDATDWGFDRHAWNLLVSIDRDGLIHKTQIDSTWADGKGGMLTGIRGLDRTHERLLQDLSNSHLDQTAIISQMLKFGHYMYITGSQDSEMFRKIMYTIRESLNSNKIQVEKLARMLWKDQKYNHAIKVYLSKDFINRGQLENLKFFWDKNDVYTKMLECAVWLNSKWKYDIATSVKVDGLTRDEFIRKNFGHSILLRVDNKIYLQRFEKMLGELYDKKTQDKHG